jgi:DNA-binding transcriptional ArsR family regulator
VDQAAVPQVLDGRRRFIYNHLILEGFSYMPTDQLSAVFGALADPTRRALLARLTTGDANVGDLAAPFNVSQPAISVT